jgi:hypothetical protein
VQFDASVEEVENLLYADFFLWEHFSGSKDIAAEGYHVPSHIQEHIDYITPGTRLRTGTAKTIPMSTARNELLVSRGGQMYLCCPAFLIPIVPHAAFMLLWIVQEVSFYVPAKLQMLPQTFHLSCASRKAAD